jgi:hypothetical protein
LDVLFVNPDSSAKAYQGLAPVYAAIEPPTWALLLAESLARSLKVVPRQDEARYNLASVYERLGRVTDARVEYQHLATTPGTAPAVAAAARRQLSALGR